MPSSAQELIARLDAMIDFVLEAKGHVDAGSISNLGDLDENVAKLCEDVETADPEIAMEVSGKMAEMVSALEELAVSLKEYQDRAGDQGVMKN